jgi:hypothetical protein
VAQNTEKWFLTTVGDVLNKSIDSESSVLLNADSDNDSNCGTLATRKVRVSITWFRSSEVTNLSKKHFPDRILSVKGRRKPRGGRKILQARQVGSHVLPG